MRTGRPRKFGSTTPVLVRVPDELLEELDLWKEQVRAAETGTSNITRSDLIRDILAKAVAQRRMELLTAKPAKPLPPTTRSISGKTRRARSP